jgi:hypothetical protein
MTLYREMPVTSLPVLGRSRQALSDSEPRLGGGCPALGFWSNETDRCSGPMGRQGSLRRLRPGSHWLSFLVLLCFGSLCHRADAQVPFPSVIYGPSVGMYGTFTDIKPNFRGYADYAVWGGTAGGYVQTSHVFGLEMRGSILRWGGAQHQAAMSFGPRMALHFGPLTTYVSALGGAARSWSWRDPSKPSLWVSSQVSPQVTGVAGVDMRVTRHISIRVGEMSYSQVFRTDRTLKTLGASAGIVYRVHF